MKLLDGRATSASLQAQIAAEVDYYLDKGWRRPHLTAILVGDDGASQTYVANKERSCKKVGFDSTVLRLPASTTEEELLTEVKRLNEDDSVDGFIIQLPLPKHIDEQKILMAVNPAKDVDGFHPENVGRLCLGLDTFVSATPYGIITLLEEYGIETRGKHCVVLGRSNIVGRPIANLLSAKAKPGDCTVTICHSRTQNIEQYTRTA
ncbi:MAG: bifunctional 5,10-methylene-tetrahydrofolate dehydrogenase/5,10-methylene-tetrahydrofolate cyclohydrolase, partial [Bacteroidales bacterium]|nr:bifunctional 5,10-methylene-tetrahydrofolate dehydrogenase/5,10-methylene-tetrahydrofolate cyclohydrolase [Bacteroidales bacterium]